MKSGKWTGAVLFFLASTWLQAAESPLGNLNRGLGVAAGGQRVTVSGLSSNGTIALIGIAREPVGGAASVESWLSSMRDDDGDGVVVLDLGRAVPLKSAWAAIDIGTGIAGVTVGDGFPLDIVRPGEAGFEIDPASGATLLRLASETAHFLLLRPGVGAWAMKAYDGGAGDTGNLPEGVPDGVLRVDPTSFSPLQPEFGDFPGLAGQDWIGVIDERLLSIAILRGVDAPAGN